MFKQNYLIPFAVMICVYLLWTAEHLKGPKDKLKRIWRNRVEWERENTTLLRSSAEKATQLEITQNMNDMSKYRPPQSVQKTHEDLTGKKIARVSKPMIAICAATHSKSTWRSLDDTALQNLLIPSIQRTISTSDRSKYDFRLYLAADHDDQFWLNNQNNVRTPDWLSVHIGFYEVPEHKIPFNPMMRAAYNDGAEYLVRINDDSEFETSDWVSKATAKLASYDPPNVGMVGPNCREGNTKIMTHDMVHRTHLDIFEYYYSDVFSGWWIDDWISLVYGPTRSTKMMDWTVKHHTYKHGRRYEVRHHEYKLLKGELKKGAGKIDAWLLTRAENMDETEPWSVCVTVTNGFHDMFNNWWFYYSKLHLNMNVIMIAEDQPTYEKYSSLPGIEVWKAQFEDSQFEDLNEKTSLNYDTVQFKKLMSRRASHFLRVLDLKPKIIFTDIDTVWLQDPRPFFAGNFDIWAQLDNEKYYCAGFIAVIKSDIVMKFFKDWNQKLTKTPQHNQPLFNRLIQQSDVKHTALPRREFPSGNLYFKGKKRDGVVIVHNNFIIGKDKKIQRFKEVGLWHQEKIEADRVVAKKCRKIYIDMGANIGIHSRFIFQPELYPASDGLLALKKMYGLLDKYLGKPADRKVPNHVCVFGFEANPDHKTRLDSLTKSYTNMGWQINYTAPLAVWVNTDGIDLHVYDYFPKAVGSSMVDRTDRSKGGKTVHVPSVDISAFVKHLKAKYDPDVIMGKLDIEGAEYQVLPALEKLGLLCAENGFEIVTYEFHSRFVSENRVNWKIPYTVPCTKRSLMVDLDSEDYYQDGQPLPLRAPKQSYQHIVYVGDSLTRYRWLDLVYQEHFKNSKTPVKLINEKFFKSWQDFYNYSTLLFGTSMKCDCYRSEEWDIPSICENRFYKSPYEDKWLTYIQWFGEHHSHGHTAPILNKKVEFDWEYDIFDTVEKIILLMNPKPTHIVFNNGYWHWTFDIARLFKIVHDSGVVPLWTQTSNSNSKTHHLMPNDKIAKTIFGNNYIPFNIKTVELDYNGFDHKHFSNPFIYTLWNKDIMARINS